MLSEYGYCIGQARDIYSEVRYWQLPGNGRGMNKIERLKQRAQKRHDERARRQNPAPGRSNADRKRINRTLDAIAHRIGFHLERTDYASLPWLPHRSIISPKDDEFQPDLAARYFVGTYNCESNGYLPDDEYPGIKATNRIQAVTWYKNPAWIDDWTDDIGQFILQKPIYCPLPCDTWGRLPITHAQWRLIAPVLVEAHLRWQWVHAVRNYFDQDEWTVGGVVGWFLDDTNAVTSTQKLVDAGMGQRINDMRSVEEKIQDAYGWTGTIIYQDVLDGFSLDGNGE